MKNTPIIKPRISQGKDDIATAHQPESKSSAIDEHGAQDKNVEDEAAGDQSSSQHKYIVAVGIAVIIMAVLLWLINRGQSNPSVIVGDLQGQSEKAQAGAAVQAGDYASVFERLKDASIKLSNAVERHREAVGTRKGAEALKGKPALVEATQEFERSANDALIETKRTYAEVLAETYIKRADHPSDFDAAVSVYRSTLDAKQLKMQGAEFARGIERVTSAPQGADVAYFEKIADGIF